MSPVLYFIYDTETCLISTHRGQAVDTNTRVSYKTQINVLLGPKTKVFTTVGKLQPHGFSFLLISKSWQYIYLALEYEQSQCSSCPSQSVSTLLYTKTECTDVKIPHKVLLFTWPNAITDKRKIAKHPDQEAGSFPRLTKKNFNLHLLNGLFTLDSTMVIWKTIRI